MHFQEENINMIIIVMGQYIEYLIYHICEITCISGVDSIFTTDGKIQKTASYIDPQTQYVPMYILKNSRKKLW